MKLRKNVIIMVIALFATGFTCTMFTKTDGTNTLVGNNEDWKNPNTIITFIPATETENGCVYFGFDNGYPQGGMNDKGLVYDGMATAPFEVMNSKDKEIFKGNLIDHAMKNCATVEEVESMFNKYNLEFLDRAQIMFVDKNGNSINIEGDEIIKKSGDFQVVTNFYLSKLKKGDEIPCNRYKIATDMLENNDVSIQTFRKVLSAVHQEREWGGTQYSNIYDVNKGLIYLYHYHNYENVVIIDVKKELAKGKHTTEVPSLFKNNHSFDSFVEKYDNKILKVLERNISEIGIEKAVIKFNEMKNKKVSSFLNEIEEWELNLFGYKFIQSGKFNEAIELFKLNIIEFPDSWNCYDSLAEAYMHAGDKELAIKNYERSIELNPDNENGKKMLQKIKDEE